MDGKHEWMRTKLAPRCLQAVSTITHCQKRTLGNQQNCCDTGFKITMPLLDFYITQPDVRLPPSSRLWWLSLLI
jgi:hypothetical protein